MRWCGESRWTPKVIFSTFVGGADRDEACGIAVSPLRAIFVAGETVSTNYPMEKPLSDARGGNTDAFLTKVCDPVMFLSSGEFVFAWTMGTDLPAGHVLSVTACRDLALQVSVEPEGSWLAAKAGTAINGVTPVSISVNPQTLEPGDYTATVTVSNPDVWFGPKSVKVVLRVLPPPTPPQE